MTYEELVKKISPVLKRITYRLNGHFASFNHDDLYQEALIRLWDDFRAGKLSDKTDSYILQGCYFHLKNYIRKARAKYPVISLDAQLNEGQDNVLLEEMLLKAQRHCPSCLDWLHDKLLAETIRNNGLTMREKEIVGFYAEGMTTRQIGSRLGISHVMVVKLTVRIREKCGKYKDFV